MLLRPGIVAEVVDQVAPADVQHGADGDEGAEADHLPQAPVQDGRAERAALAEKATLPARAIVCPAVAFSPVTGLMTPRQFGPMMRIRRLAGALPDLLFQRRPAGARLLNPAEITTAPRTPAPRIPRRFPERSVAGVATTARSTWSGMAATLG